MFKFNPNINKKIGEFLSPVVDFVHNYLGLSPNFVSGLSFATGIIASGFILSHDLEMGLFIMLISLLLDGLDGPIARRFHYDLKFGEKLDTIMDRSLEIVTFISLAIAGFVEIKIVILSLVSILLMTSLRDRSRFDPGFKRTVIFLGVFTGFTFAFNLIFLVNLGGFIINLLILDLDKQQKEDLLSY